MNKNILLIMAALLFSCESYAGKVNLPANAQDCNFGDDASTKCSWKPQECSKPTLPALAEIADEKSYKKALDDYNAYIQLSNNYLSCVLAEAKKDIEDSFPDLVQKDVKEISNIIQKEANFGKNALDKNPFSIIVEGAPAVSMTAGNTPSPTTAASTLTIEPSKENKEQHMMDQIKPSVTEDKNK